VSEKIPVRSCPPAKNHFKQENPFEPFMDLSISGREAGNNTAPKRLQEESD